MPVKLDDCVRKVRAYLKKHGLKGNAWAICNASISKSKLKRKRKSIKLK